MANSNGFTKTEQAILNILADGKPHHRKELHACCGPSLMAVVTQHIVNIRKKLPPGHDIVARVLNRGKLPLYQHVRKLASANDGRK
jgi:hypothetical protein